jgi:quercetin dioxygenase-like cupin family protein
MFVKNYRELPVEPSGVEGLTVRWGINASQGANNFGMRILELEPGKSSSRHQHENEHGVYVLTGKGEVEAGDQTQPVSEGTVIFIPSNEDHQFHNTGTDVMRFVDVVKFPIIIPK